MTPVWIVLHHRHSNIPPAALSTHWTPSAAHVAAGKVRALPGERVDVMGPNGISNVFPGDIRRGPEDRG